MIIMQPNSKKEFIKSAKIIKKSKIMKNPEDELSRIEDYYLSLRDIGIPLPHYFGGEVQKGRVITTWGQLGMPVAEVIKKADLSKVLDALNSILNFNHWAFMNKIPLYPSLNSYAMDKDKLIFVDLFKNRIQKKPKPTNKLINSLIIFGLIQKIALPVREIISLRTELQTEIIESCEKYLEQWQMQELTRDLKVIANYRVPKCPKKDKINLRISAGYENIFYFNHNQKIISLSPKIIWTPFLLYRDMEICKKMGIVFNQF